MNDRMNDRIGSEVAGYRIVSVLGQGGMGTVFVAEQTSPRRKVVLKLLRAELSKDDAFRRRFVHESEAAASTEHPNIVPIYSAGEEDGALYIAMRYVEGTDLRDLITTEGSLDPDRAVEIVSQIAGALDAAHRRGLVHRDVKPGNILLDTAGNAYLTDFGLIKRSEVDTGLTKTGQFMGSIEYCAPEQIRGEEVDGRADVYSLACVLFESIEGRPPFRRDTEIATLYAHLEQAPPKLSTGPSGPFRELDRVIAKGMDKRPSERYATAGAFARDARHAVGVSSGERDVVPVRRPRRTLMVAIGATVVALAFVVAAVASLTTDGDGRPPGPGPDASVRAVVEVDPETGAIDQSIEGFTYRTYPLILGDLAAGEGGIWMGNPPTVQHLDPVTDSVRATIHLRTPSTAIAIGFRTVWVATPGDLERINPATDQTLPAVHLPVPPGIQSAGEVAVGEGAIWLTRDQTLYRIDPVEGRVVDRLAITGSTGVAVGEGSVWVVDDFTGELTAFDEQTGNARGSAEVPGSLDAVVAGGGSAWVLDREAGIVTQVDPATLGVLGTVRVGTDERDIVFGADAVWLADGSDRTVTRIDPNSTQTTSFEIDGTVVYVAVDEATDELWALAVP